MRKISLEPRPVSTLATYVSSIVGCSSCKYWKKRPFNVIWNERVGKVVGNRKKIGNWKNVFELNKMQLIWTYRVGCNATVDQLLQNCRFTHTFHSTNDHFGHFRWFRCQHFDSASKFNIQNKFDECGIFGNLAPNNRSLITIQIRKFYFVPNIY